nr:immunoglobulin light chain junction region [Macaca mulatta]
CQQYSNWPHFTF